MGRYDEFLYQLIKKGIRSSFERMPKDEINVITKEHPGVPADYIEYLEEIGYGDIGDNYFMLYGGLVQASEIYEESKAEKLKDIVFLGDYYNGHSIGFSKKGEWEMVEVDDKHNITFLNTSFESFIKNKLDEFLGMLSY
ncbi:hypothetical protein [Pseudobacteroides cellulosolvens]|uniref:Cell wall assembly/cell proliferation coordinating protein, KNR4-like protein n=1 Tax=Pseudobacteroides cellulosolvens ATCC 35603 = DSM 2933 TaxID=398512 RepID=A0A0L6JLP9_9FIRM|nr:hypothetical protein [Pseudobacteroides cellulosolvens]KNY26736.1 hypothetical protein Bccel_2001 [Pseudobacteroides cellulosolvens ATCC 35603 = DSM 2933]